MEKLKRAYIITEMKDWNDIFRLNQRFMSNFIFRGQGNEEWPLVTSLARMVQIHHPNYIDKIIPAMYEKRMLDEFMWKYPIYEKNHIPSPGESIEWLSLMQHYGAPTRMLDFSYSMYIALFMAIDGSSYSKSAIWAINKYVLNEKPVKNYCAENKTNVITHSVLDAYIYNRAQTAINKSSAENKETNLYITRPHMPNERINRQQGLFIIPSSVEVGFEEILKDYYDENFYLEMSFDEVVKMSTDYHYSQQAVSVLKLKIPKVLNYNLSNTLRQMNITSETMYPGLDGLARSMSCLRVAMGDYMED